MNGNELLAGLLAREIDPKDVSPLEVSEALKNAPIPLKTECALFVALQEYEELWEMLPKMYPSPQAFCQ